MTKKIFFLLVVFLIGASGGMWAQAFLLPSMAANPAFENWQFIKDWNARTQVVAPVQEITITENEAIQRVAERTQGTVVAVKSASGRAGSGLVFTSDGLVVTLASLVPQGYQVRVHDGEALPAQVLKRDLQNNLALLKIEKTGLQTAGFVGNGGVQLGEQVVLVAGFAGTQGTTILANQGLIRTKTEADFTTSIQETAVITGAPLFTLEGSVAGLAYFDRQGTVHAIPSSILRAFLGL